MNKYF